jgi:hypothetical protein
MQTWTRDDGRYFSIWMEQDLFGLVVVAAYGGRGRNARFRCIPVSCVEHGERVIKNMQRRRLAHGYTQEP